jgi:putative membrane protein
MTGSLKNSGEERMRKIVISIIIAMIVTAPFVFAADLQIKRTQTVYSVLDWDGKVLDTSIVNWIRIEGEGKIAIEDYPEIENLTTLDPEVRPKIESQKVTWDVECKGVKDIFYTGNTTKPLPIKTNISLKLDGQNTTPEEMLGESGKVDIAIEFENLMSSNEILSWNAGNVIKSENKTIYQPMTIIVQADFPVESFEELKSENAFSMTVGSHKKLMWTLFPKPKEKIEVSYSSQNISIPSIQISIQPVVPKIPIPEIDGNMIDLMGMFSGDDDVFDILTDGIPLDSKNALEQINKTKSLMDASKSLIDDSKKQLSEFSSSFQSLENGLIEMQKGSLQIAELSKGHKQLLETMKTNFDQNQDGFNTIIKGVEDASNSTGKVSRDLFTLKVQLEEIRDGISAIKPSIEDKDSLEKANNILETANTTIAKIDGLKTEQDKGSTILKTLVNGGVLNGKSVPALTSLPESLDLLNQVLSALIGGGEVMGQQLPGINTTIDGLNGISKGLTTIIEGGQVNGIKTPPLSSIPEMISKSSSKMNVLVDGGIVNGINVPPQKETLQMIDDFKKMLEDFTPLQSKMDQISKKLDKIIKDAGGKENLLESIEDTQELFFSGSAELEKMKEKESKYKSFIGNTPNAENSLLFVLKMKEYSIDDNKKNVKPIDLPKDENPYANINKYKYYILYIAIIIIIASFIVNWIVINRNKYKK